MRSGAAAKLRVERIRMQRVSVEKLDKDSKADGERRMVTPWHSRIIEGLEALSMLSPCQIKLFLVGLYDWETIVAKVARFQGFRVSRQNLVALDSLKL
jgi:hypothetical protein